MSASSRFQSPPEHHVASPPLLVAQESRDHLQLRAAQPSRRVESRQVHVGHHQFPGLPGDREAGDQQVVALPALPSRQLQALHMARRSRREGGQADGDPGNSKADIRGEGPPPPRQALLDDGQQVHPAVDRRGAGGLLQQKHVGPGLFQESADAFHVAQHFRAGGGDEPPPAVGVELRPLPQPAEAQVPAQDLDFPRRLPGLPAHGLRKRVLLDRRRAGSAPQRDQGDGQNQYQRCYCAAIIRHGSSLAGVPARCWLSLPALPVGTDKAPGQAHRPGNPGSRWP